jgi:hypothetical protein
LIQAPTAPAVRAVAVRIRVEGSGTAVVLFPSNWNIKFPPTSPYPVKPELFIWVIVAGEVVKN